jgi:hypothetical protein
MSKRLTFTLSDEAAALVQDRVPYHSRGAYVSALILADRGQSIAGAKRCKCGLVLAARVYFEQGVWAADSDDLAAYRAHQPPAHDVISGTGKRLRVGACAPVATQQR